MKFNKLYLHGFKSFVDKTTIEFPDGITAIVGPNGSGKSNVMDAVRWVFGEQNAKELRGTDMEDVVFNGSQKRKPAGFAEVGLTLSDIDDAVASKYGTFSELTITRKFYKTGEREYYINNRKCRLKDIKDIFMDTGLGARSISIIEQGKVDKIINASPEELRFFLEETAGVTKFKDKKREAERRLNQTRDNLDRVNDIITEIITRLETLSSQVEVLKKSEGLQTSKRTLEKKYLASSYATKLNEGNDKSTLKAEINQKYEQKLAEYANIVKEETAANNNLTDLSNKNKELQEKRLETSTLATKVEGELHSLNVRLSTAEQQKEQISLDIERIEQELERITDTKEILSDKKEIAETETEDLAEKVSDLDDIIGDIKQMHENLKGDFKDLDNKYLHYTSNISTKKSDLAKREISLEHQESTITRLMCEKDDIAKQMNDFNDKKQSLADKITVTREVIEDVKQKAQGLKDNFELLKLEENTLSNKQTELSATIKSIDANISFLESQLIERTEFFSHLSPKLLIDIIDNTEHKKLVDIADVLCFEDERREEVLNAIDGAESSVRFTFFSEVEKINDELQLLEILPTHNSITYKSHIYSKHGSDDSAVKIIALKERISEERSQVENLQSELTGVASRIDEISTDIEAKKMELDIAQKRAEEQNSILIAQTNEYDNICTDYERGNKRISTINKEIEIAEFAYNEFEERCIKLQEEINELNEKKANIEEEREYLEEKLDNITTQLEEKREEQQELKIELSGANERLASAIREAEIVEREYTSNMSSLDNLKTRLHNLIHVDKADWEANIVSLTEQHKQINIQLLTIESELSESEKDIEELKQTIEDLHKSANTVNSEIKAHDDEIRQLEVALASASSFTEAIATQYFEKFGDHLASCYQEYVDADFKPNKMREEIARIDGELDGLGAINLNALNDYQEAEDRYNFLTGQRTDLEGSITDIMAFIYDTDQTTVKMFHETYNSVKDKFIEVFKILFGDGEAELRLSDPDDILNTGVEIYIQPPGKKLQHMGLLSGGEKALTAMTLLFALFLQKPTPFCFLDEVDAPLDDANVTRYTSMVKALADKTQFILITHNHNTMAAADSLYGVTMQEFGVSSVLSVKIEQLSTAGR